MALEFDLFFRNNEITNATLADLLFILLNLQYEKAASLLSSHDPPIALAKVDANEDSNKELASEYDVKGFPTLKIFRNGGKHIQEYKGPREAEGIVEYLKKQSGPASVEIKSADDATTFVGDDKVVIVSLCPDSCPLFMVAGSIFVFNKSLFSVFSGWDIPRILWRRVQKLLGCG